MSRVQREYSVLIIEKKKTDPFKITNTPKHTKAYGSIVCALMFQSQLKCIKGFRLKTFDGDNKFY